MKNPVNTRITGFLNLELGQKVESEGFEPSSKQAIQKLSTRLVFACFSMQSRPKTTNFTLIIN